MSKWSRGPVEKVVVLTVTVDGREGEVMLKGSVTQRPQQLAHRDVASAQTIKHEDVRRIVDHEDDVGIPQEGPILDCCRQHAESLTILDGGAGTLANCIAVRHSPRTHAYCARLHTRRQRSQCTGRARLEPVSEPCGGRVRPKHKRIGFVAPPPRSPVPAIEMRCPVLEIRPDRRCQSALAVGAPHQVDQATEERA